MNSLPIPAPLTPTSTLWLAIPQVCSKCLSAVKNFRRHRYRPPCCFSGSSSAARFPLRTVLQSPISSSRPVKAIVLDSSKTICRKTHTKSADQQSLERVEKPQSKQPSFDPTAKRPTQKCDPYGLQGQSLSYSECMGLMPTLEEGWELISFRTEHIESRHETMTSKNPPTFLQKKYFHPSFHAASQFLAHITLLATNNNHYPYLAMERLLVDDINVLHGKRKIVNDQKMKNEKNHISFVEIGDENINDSKRKGRKTKGWAFVSTVRCSSYRPPMTKREQSNSNESTDNEHGNKGLTYHDFHLAMNIDVEVNRKEVRHWLWQEP
ncbi:hypothetical protein ACHAXS_001736 [Conticribra weissflogii]